MARHLLVTNDFPPKTGGIQVYLYELWRRLGTERAAVLTATSDPDVERFDHDCGVVVERVPRGTLFLPSWRAYRDVEAAIARHQPELVLLDPAWPLGLLGPHLSRPYGVVLHGAEVAIPGRLPVAASSLRRVLRHAEVAVCAGSYPEAEARRVAAEYTCPVVRIPPGVDTERFRPLGGDERRAVRAELGLADEDFVIASYSRLVPRKGMDTLIEATARLAEFHPRLRVLIGGDGRDRSRLEHLAARCRAPVRFLGRTSDELHPKWIGASDLMVMDCRSRWLGLEQEGFGIVFLEAAACGVAQVAGRSGGSHDAVRDGVTGSIVQDTRDPLALAAAISGLIEDPERRARYARHALEVARASFTWDHLARELSKGLAPFDHAESFAPS